MYPSSTTTVMALTVVAASSTGFAAFAYADSSSNPSDKYDLSHWNITLPLDADGDEKLTRSRSLTFKITHIRISFI